MLLPEGTVAWQLAAHLAGWQAGCLAHRACLPRELREGMDGILAGRPGSLLLSKLSCLLALPSLFLPRPHASCLALVLPASLSRCRPRAASATLALLALPRSHAR